MKRWKKLFLGLFVLLLLSQIPFAHRRSRLGRLNSAIQQLNSGRVVNETAGGIAEFKGGVHVHSFLGGHSSGNFEEIISAAQVNHLDFVIMTEHPAKDFDTSAMTLNGKHGGVLFVNGNEVRTANGDRLLLIPGDANAATDSERSTADVLSRRTSGLALAAYPEDFKSWDAAGYNGVEVYNVYTNARAISPLVMFFDGLWSYRSYPDLLFANFYRRPAQSLQKWDEAIRQKGKSFVATPGNDAHANIGLSLNDSSGKTWLGFKLDPYERSFRLVRLHILTPDLSQLNGQLSASSLDEKSLLRSISAGHCFIGFDLFGDSSGFRFTASDSDEARMMGDEIKLEKEARLSVKLPIQGRIVLLRDGTVVHDDTGVSSKDYTVTEKGSYRVEVYLPQLPRPAGEQPWIISNPIYVR